MKARLLDALVLVVLAGSVATQAPQLHSEFTSSSTLAQHVVPWSELLYCLAGSAAVLGFIVRARWASAAAVAWTLGCFLAATFSSRAYGDAPWSGVAFAGIGVLLIGVSVVAWTRRRTTVRSQSS